MIILFINIKFCFHSMADIAYFTSEFQDRIAMLDEIITKVDRHEGFIQITIWIEEPVRNSGLAVDKGHYFMDYYIPSKVALITH